MKKTEPGFLNTAFVYAGTLMGAGFASGREIWQFFGVFGKFGYVGLLVVTALFVLLGYMTSRVAGRLNTNDVGKVVAPGGNRFLAGFAANLIATALFGGFITLSSAGGALFHQQFGQSRALGGAVVVLLVILTVLGGFDRISKVFRFVMPVLMITVVSVSLVILAENGGAPAAGETFPASPLASRWGLAAALYVSYNIIGAIPVISSASINGKNERRARLGAAFGGMLLGSIAFGILAAMMTEPVFSNGADMPMLAFTENLSPAFNAAYTCALFFAIYASSTSIYYGFTVRLKEGPGKKAKIILLPWIAFALGLFGFTRIIAYVFPLIGYAGFSIVLMLVVNYARLHLNVTQM